MDIIVVIVTIIILICLGLWWALCSVAVFNARLRFVKEFFPFKKKQTPRNPVTIADFYAENHSCIRRFALSGSREDSARRLAAKLGIAQHSALTLIDMMSAEIGAEK